MANHLMLREKRKSLAHKKHRLTSFYIDDIISDISTSGDLSPCSASTSVVVSPCSWKKISSCVNSFPVSELSECCNLQTYFGHSGRQKNFENDNLDARTAVNQGHTWNDRLGSPQLSRTLQNESDDEDQTQVLKSSKNKESDECTFQPTNSKNGILKLPTVGRELPFHPNIFQPRLPSFTGINHSLQGLEGHFFGIFQDNALSETRQQITEGLNLSV